MKCFYYPDQDAVGTCSQCGKGACRQCIDDVGGAMLCKACMAHELQEIHKEQQDLDLERTRIIEGAKKRLLWAKRVFYIMTVATVFIGGTGVISSVSSSGKSDVSVGELLLGIPLAGIVGGYLVWSCYWGVPAAFGWLRKLLNNMGCFLIANPVTWLILIVVACWIPFFVGYMYGVFGGAFYERAKWRRIAEGQF